MRRKAVAVLAAVLAPAVALYGWGHEGHRIVADIAQERLTEVARRNVQSLIGNNTLASVANWADQIRPERDETFGWHFVDIPRYTYGEMGTCGQPAAWKLADVWRKTGYKGDFQWRNGTGKIVG